METNPSPEPSKWTKYLPYLYYLLNWRVLVGFLLIIYRLFSSDIENGQLYKSKYDNQYHYNPPLSEDAKGWGLFIGVFFVLWGVSKQYEKIKTPDNK
jgi:hypothetical protein